MKKEITGIYRITNLTTGRVYIGSSKTLYKRLRDYKRKKLNRISKKVRDSIIEFGYDNHEFKIICVFNIIDKKDLHTYEDGFILLYVNRLGEEKVFNSHCNERKKWMSKEYYNEKINPRNETIEKMKLNSYMKKCLGVDNHISKNVNQYNFNGVFIKKWDYIKQACIELEIDNSCITKVCKHKRKSAGGYIWRYHSEYPDCKDLIL